MMLTPSALGVETSPAAARPISACICRFADGRGILLNGLGQSVWLDYASDGGKMTKIEQGGYAFQDGMALRDYFAGKAFDRLLQDIDGRELYGGVRAVYPDDVVAPRAYAYAICLWKGPHRKTIYTTSDRLHWCFEVGARLKRELDVSVTVEVVGTAKKYCV